MDETETCATCGRRLREHSDGTIPDVCYRGWSGWRQAEPSHVVAACYRLGYERAQAKLEQALAEAEHHKTAWTAATVRAMDAQAKLEQAELERDRWKRNASAAMDAGIDIPERIEMETLLECISDVATGRRPISDFMPAGGVLGEVVKLRFDMELAESERDAACENAGRAVAPVRVEQQDGKVALMPPPSPEMRAFLDSIPKRTLTPTPMSVLREIANRPPVEGRDFEKMPEFEGFAEGLRAERDAIREDDFYAEQAEADSHGACVHGYLFRDCPKGCQP